MSKFLDLFQGIRYESPPLWFMRQAGRSLPEYREVRSTCNTFLDLCYSPDLVAKVTLQPIERFNLDAAILFSDILVVPHALGQKLSFEEQKGPLLSPLKLSSFQHQLSTERFFETLAPVYEAIRLIKAKHTPLLGFGGAPWTLALYMLEGEGSRDFAKAKQQAFQQEEEFSSFLEWLSYATASHLVEQVKAGVDGIQLFDTWAGLCPATHFQKWIIEPTQLIVSRLREEFPLLPIIGFPKGIGAHLIDYGRKTGVSALSLDTTTSLSWAVKEIPNNLIFQGNLDPLLLVAGGEPLQRAIESIHEEMKGRPYIFNLGHGILPQTPLAHIEECVRRVRALG
jgi:uroporphyrinogen decarboxylase